MEFLKNEYIRYVLILLLGITIGALFYPTKRIEEKLSFKYEQEMSSLKELHSKETSQLIEKFDSSLKEQKQLHSESEKKVSKLSEEVKSLQSKQKTSYFKLIKPDGTIEIKKFTESEINESTKVVTQIQEEFKTKVDQIETKWSEIHKEKVIKIQKEFESKEANYKKTIEDLQKSKITSINEKTHSIEFGVQSDKSYYGGVSMDIWGPFSLGVSSTIGSTPAVLGVGLGMKF
jgi:hypothetical protein